MFLKLVVIFIGLLSFIKVSAAQSIGNYLLHYLLLLNRELIYHLKIMIVHYLILSNPTHVRRPFLEVVDGGNLIFLNNGSSRIGK